jgi:hypothetical protein
MMTVMQKQTPVSIAAPMRRVDALAFLDQMLPELWAMAKTCEVEAASKSLEAAFYAVRMAMENEQARLSTLPHLHHCGGVR